MRQAADVHETGLTDSDAQAHMAGSEILVDLVDELLAVWDGKPARGYGGPPTWSPTPNGRGPGARPVARRRFSLDSLADVFLAWRVARPKRHHGVGAPLTRAPGRAPVTRAKLVI
jgi:hypothetical protein